VAAGLVDIFAERGFETEKGIKAVICFRIYRFL